MKMFVFYFTAFMFDMNNGAYIPVKNSFVYKTEEDCRLVEKTVLVNSVDKELYHSLAQDDYVTVLGLTDDNKVPIVKQLAFELEIIHRHVFIPVLKNI